MIHTTRALTNNDIIKFVTKLKIPNFRGVYMRDSLPTKKPWKNECMVLNDDSLHNSGGHWCCYVKINVNVFYFDSFGRLPPTKELVEYLGNTCNIHYNYKRYQPFNTNICGHLCLRFLHEFYKKINEMRNI